MTEDHDAHDVHDVHDDVREEQDYLDRAYEGLESMRAEASRMLESVLDLGRGGTFQSRTERDIVVRTSMARLAQLDTGDEALTFGRIDRAPEDGADAGTGAGAEGESFHIGRLAVSGTDHEPLVVDWRAPVAEPFYRATGLDPQGLARRRHLAVSGRTVTGVEDEVFARRGATLTAVSPAPTDSPTSHDGHDGLSSDGLELGGPGALLATLGQSRTGHMGDIVATIQREQDEIIRSPLAGLLVVQGGPGTGKTAVALHRAAYLLYTHRFPLERQGVLVVGPNPLFLRYIERVLPSLGETGVTLSTITGLVPEIRVSATEPPALAHLKGDARMAAVIARAVRTRERALRDDVAVPLGPTTLRLTASDTAEIVAAARRRPGTHNARRRYVESQVLRRLSDQFEGVRRRAVERSTGAVTQVHGDVGDVDAAGDAGLGAGDVDVAQLRRAIRRVPALSRALDRMWPRLSPHELVHDLFGAPPLLAAAGSGVLSGEEVTMLGRPRVSSLEAVAWTAADAALVDEARALLGPRKTASRRRARVGDREASARSDGGFWPAGLGASPMPLSNGSGEAADEDVRAFGHIVVDEAQDLSPMQLRMLRRRSISGSMTIVGDLAQATGPWAPATWQDIAAHLSVSRVPHLVELTIGYRTPAEVIEIAAGVLAEAAPGLKAPRPVRRSGAPPSFWRADPASLGRRAAEVAQGEMAATGGGRTAVLVPTTLLAEVSRALRDRGLDPVDPRNATGPGLGAPLVVLPAAESHGLEFDAVVVVEPAEIVRAGALGAEAGPGAASAGYRALYVALTRPTRRLAVVHALALPEGLAAG